MRERMERLEARTVPPEPQAPPRTPPAAAKRPRPGAHRTGRKPLSPRRR
jgi:hypothetical protein